MLDEYKIIMQRHPSQEWTVTVTVRLVNRESSVYVTRESLASAIRGAYLALRTLTSGDTP